ncbi:hypothetical protein PSPO01_04649 [Paraphaeosphaeria sporulosa]
MPARAPTSPMPTSMPISTYILESSPPPRASSPVPGPTYDMEFKYTLRVNKVTKLKDLDIYTQLAFRPGWRGKSSRPAYKIKTLVDFIEGRDALIRDMDCTVESLRGYDILEIKVDVRIEVALL